MDPLVSQKIEHFFAQYPLHHYKKGQILIQAHDQPEHVIHLVLGKVKQYDITQRGDEVLLNIFKPPAFFPMAYAINHTPNQYVFEAETDIEVHLAPVTETVAFVQHNPDVLFDLLSRVYSGVDGLLGRLAHLMAGSARSRVLYEVLIECRRFGDTGDQDLTLALTERELGARAGLARETISRELRQLKAERLISVTPAGIIIHDLDRLAAAAGHSL